MTEVPYRTWCEVDLGAIRKNIQIIQKKVGPRRKIIAVIKSDGYGHGATRIAKIAQSLHIPLLGLATLDEAVALRREGIKTPILLLSCCQTYEVDGVIEYNCIPNICTLDVGKKFEQAATRRKTIVPFHTEIDTGIGRVGAYYPEASSLIQQLTRLSHLKFEGLFTHFASADDDPEFTARQVKRYQETVEQITRLGIRIPFRHVANSATVLAYPDFYFDGARPGLIIYGLYPAKTMRKLAKLNEAMSLKSRVIYLKKAKPGRTISYGHTYTTRKNTIIATIGAGYRNGYPRLLSNQGEMLIHGKRVPIIGRICMDQCMVDVSSVPGVKPGDEVVLFGEQKNQQVEIDEIARLASTISYEIVCTAGRVNRRIYKNS